MQPSIGKGMKSHAFFIAGYAEKITLKRGAQRTTPIGKVQQALSTFR